MTFTYYTGVANEIAERLNLPLMARPGSYGPKTVARYSRFAIDNGCFTNPIRQGNKYEARWLRYLDRMEPFADKCDFAVVPDVVADAAHTLGLWHWYANEVLDRGYVPAFALQDGAERDGMVPWGDVDMGVVFVGGTTEWKLSSHALYLCAYAHRQNLGTHMGRCNTLRRIRRAQEMCIDSGDGTLLKHDPQRIGRILPRVSATPQLALA